MSKLTRVCSLALSSAAIVAMHPAASDAHEMSISRAQIAAAPRVGELKVNLTWPFDSSRLTATWGRHTRHSEHQVELRVILTDRYEQCTETLGPATESGETEGPFCEQESAEACFRIWVIYASKKQRRDPDMQELLDETRKVIVGQPKRIDCELADRKQRSRGSTRPQGR
jgi:hypothetical protein